MTTIDEKFSKLQSAIELHDTEAATHAMRELRSTVDELVSDLTEAEAYGRDLERGELTAEDARIACDDPRFA